MKLQLTRSPDIVNSQSIKDGLLPYFSWVSPWKIQVSGGLQLPLGDLLMDLQDILGDKPNIDFLRIIEELEVDEIFTRKLRVFIHCNDKNEAKDSAVQQAITKAEMHSQMICYRCGNKFKPEAGEEEELIEQYLLEKGISKYKAQFMKVCLVCINKFNAAQGKTKAIEKVDVEEISEEYKKQSDDTSVCIEETLQQQKEEELKKVEELDQKTNDSLSVDDGVYLYSMSDVDALESANKGATRDQASRIKSLVKRIRESSYEKELALIPKNWEQQCNELERNFPNFVEVIQFVFHQFALSNVSDQVLRIPPFLLVGDAGIGKTEFMLTLSEMCATALEVIDISSAQTGIVLTGSETYWGNSQPGMLFNRLIFGNVANPILMLDEIDKAKESSAHSPLAALHGLLEARQARQFKDLSVPEITLDASHVLWIATANTLDAIEKPILDRFMIFHIAVPTSEQMVEVVKNQYRRFLNDSPAGNYFESEISPDVLKKLCQYHPRNVRKILNLSFGIAASQQRKYLTIEDIQESEIKGKSKQQKFGIGFMCAGI